MIEPLKNALLGDWVSIAPEVRPSKSPDGGLKSFFLTREFRYLTDDRFELLVTSLADPFGNTPLAKILIKGHMFWRAEHPIGPGARKVDFHADEAYEVTPLHTGFANLLNQVARQGYEEWQIGHAQSILRKAFPPFGLAEGQEFMEFDLVYLTGGMLFWGARHVDGRGFDTEENRPTNLQIPMIRK